MANKKILIPLLVLPSLLLAGCNNSVISSSDKQDSTITESDSQSQITSENVTSEKTSEIPSEEIPSESEPQSSEEDIEIINPQNSEAVETTISQLLSISKSRVDGTLYRVHGVMQEVNNDYYGNFDLTDDTGSITVYGCSKSRSSMSGSGSNHSFSNTTDFESLNLHGGDEITMEVVHLVFGNDFEVPEIQGYVTSIKRNNIWTINPTKYGKQDPYQGSYYNSIGDETGKALGTKLHDLMINTHTTYLTYKPLTNHFKHTDSRNGKVIDFYTEKEVKRVNREHVWPKSRSNDVWVEEGGGADLHHLRACEANVNSTRGNKKFAPAYNRENCNNYSHVRGGYCYYSASRSNFGIWEPADCIKGDVARIIAYTFVHYTTSYGGKTNKYTGQLYLNDVIGVDKSQINNLLCNWNALDPVDDYEIARNEYTYGKQGNRNPFVDHPSYINRLFN